MKTRNTLVSNSSSSSYVIIARDIYIAQLQVSDIPKGIFVIGKQLSEGIDIIIVTDKEMLNYIQDHSELFHRSFVDGTRYCDPSDIKINQSMIGKTMYSCVGDLWNSSSIESLKKEYPHDEGIK